MTATETRKKAKEALNGKWGKAALIMFCYSLFQGLLGGISGKFSDNELISSILNIVAIIISAPVSYGLVIAFMKLKRNEDVNSFDFLTLGFNQFSRSWMIALNQALKLILPIICTIMSTIFFAVTLAFYNPNKIMAVAGTIPQPKNTGLLILALILLFISFIYYYIKSLSLCLSYNIAYDNPEMSALECCNKSQTLMKGNKGNYFVLILSLTWWIFLLGFILYGIMFGSGIAMLISIVRGSAQMTSMLPSFPILIIAILGLVAMGIFSFWYSAYIKICHLSFYEEVLDNKNEII